MVIKFPSDIIYVKGEVELEIGFGNGEFLKRLATSYPYITHVGVEISWQSVKRAAMRLKTFKNVVLVWGDVWPFLMFGAKKLKFHRVFSLFPDPWPKKRHIRKRIFSEDFWKLLSTRVKDDVQVTIISDHYKALLWFYDNALKSGCWWGYVSESKREFGTKYERKWRGMSKSIYEAVFFLESPCNFKISEREVRIPKLKSIKLVDISGDYKLRDGSHLSIKRCFICENALLIKAIISEDKVLHRVWFEVEKRGSFWKIKPSDFSKFYPTKSLQLAIDKIAGIISG